MTTWNGQALMRLSAQVYNRPEEYERLAAKLPALLKTGIRAGPAGRGAAIVPS